MSFFKKKAGIAIIIVLLIAALSATVTHFSGRNIISDIGRTIISPFSSGASYIANGITKQLNFIWEASTYKDQNEYLTNQLIDAQKKNKEIATYQEEVDRLKNLLDLKDSITDYSTVAASVIGYSSNNSYDKIEINKGSASGIGIGNAVIASNGIVGTVTEVGLNWSTVTTILSPESSTGIIVTRTNDIGVIEGDAELGNKNQCKLSFIAKDANIVVGDLLETSGTGGIYPPHFDIGTISEISADNMGMLNYAIVEPKVNIKDAREVLVINGVAQ